MNQKRIIGLDIIRGLAIAIVLFANVREIMPIMEGEKQPHFTQIDHFIKQFFAMFIDMRFITLFTLLFGIGMGIFMNNARKKEISPIKLMFRRLIFLFVVGIPGLILILPYAQYAIYGCILMFLFLLPKARYTLWVSIVLLVANIGMTIGTPQNNNVDVMFLGVMAFGLYLSQSGIIYRFKEYKKFFMSTLAISSIVIIGALVLKQLDPHFAWYSVEDMVTPFQSIIYFVLLLFITDRKSVQRVMTPFEKLGKTAFTNFLVQMIFLDLFLTFVFPYPHPTPLQAIYIGIPILVVFILLTYWWLAHYRQGPLEMLWRKWTYKNVSQK
ncbi:DUF418 domain-containing protein [Staphylococcus petrasii]|uniref:DUF418 domain-containing protein n=1 Tax=Staphylococcus petrasii TaxID=1276936 RepID=UPI001F57B6BD|nr:DUF418 domain-containing protein [Staphylococcus petrasii]MCI2774022.1 DUF418 domain-containing protein [Staphylococcus petrasii]